MTRSFLRKFDLLCWASIVILFFLFQCSGKQEALFRSLEPRVTGIDFSNTITYSDTLSVLDFEYMYNGGGAHVIFGSTVAT